MAKSIGYFGLRRGSTKSHTFSVVGGKQITKDRVEGGKNPRTLGQMRQRCIAATCTQAYSAMKSICDHSFEGFSAGNDCMNEFKNLNMSLLRQCVQYDNGFFGFNKWGEKGMMRGAYILSNGTLASPLPNLAMLSVDVANRQGVIDIAYGQNLSDIIDEFNMRQFGDIVTVCVAYPKQDGSYGFGALRFTYKQGEDVEHSFDFDACGDITAASFSYAAGKITATFRTDHNWDENATADLVYLAAIASQKRNGKWYRSKAQFDVQDATPSYDEAIATYPVGQERFMNGSGDSGVSAPASGSNSSSSSSSSNGSSGSSSGTSGTPETPETLSAPTISGNTTFSESSQVSISAADGAEIRYTLDGSTPTAESTLYSEAFTVTETTSVKAIAIKDGQTSEVASKTFVKSSGEGGMDQN